MNETDWCKGFCRTCGTGCAQYCDDIQLLKADLCQQVDEIKRLRGALKHYAQGASVIGFDRGEIAIAALEGGK